MINPYSEFVANISPVEFEKYCYEILKAYAENENLNDFNISYNKKIGSHDGIYQIDIYAEFTAMSVKFKVIAECKRYTYPIEREKIVILADKVQSLGAQKGIFISTSGFQSGAVKYAKEHGITLLQIFDKNIIHIQNRCRAKDDLIDKMIEQIYISMPEYYAYEWDEFDFPYNQVYPSIKYIKNKKKRLWRNI